MYGTQHLQCDYAMKQCKIISQRLSTEAVKLEMRQRVSTFQKQVNEKHEVNENMLEKTFAAIYWLAKEEISNQKLIPLLELLENLGVSELKYFQHRSRPSVREMFITLRESIQEIILERIRRAKSFGILADDASGVAVCSSSLSS